MRIGIDLGGTKIEGIVLAESGREIARKRIAAPRGSYGDTLAAITGLVAEIVPAGKRRRAGGDRRSGKSITSHRTDRKRQFDMADRPAIRCRYCGTFEPACEGRQ